MSELYLKGINVNSFADRIFNPSSTIYGLITILASLGTIAALVLTIKSLRQNSDQSELLSRKSTLDNLFSNIELMLHRIIYLKEWVGGTEVHFGRLAIYRAKFGQSQILFKNNNIENIENYLISLNMHVGVIGVVLSRVKHFQTRDAYRRKLEAEVRFMVDYIQPLLKELAETNELQKAKALETLELISSTVEDAKNMKIILQSRVESALS